MSKAHNLAYLKEETRRAALAPIFRVQLLCPKGPRSRHSGLGYAASRCGHCGVLNGDLIKIRTRMHQLIHRP